MTRESNHNQIASVIKAAEVLRLFKEKDEWGIAELARELDAPVSSIHRLVSTLESVGYVYQNKATARYRLGLELFIIGNKVKIIKLLEEKAMPHIERLAVEVNESIHISILQDREVVAILSANANRQLAVLPHLGQSRRIYATAVGKCLLAFNSHNCYERFLMLNEEMVPYTANTITDRETLLAELDRVRMQGFAIDNEEAEEDLVCVGAPIFGSQNTCIAAMSCSAPKSRYLGREQLVQTAVLKTAAAISESM